MAGFAKDGITVWKEHDAWQFLVKCGRYRKRGTRLLMHDAIVDAERQYKAQVEQARVR